MSFSFPPFNYLSNVSCCVSKRQTNKNPSLLKFPSSIISPPKGAETSSKINTSFNGVGIIGGLSVDSSLNFAKKLVNFPSENEGNSPPFVLCSDPQLSNVLSSIRRSSSPLISTKTESIVENLRRKRLLLEKSHVRCIVMPCHVSHSWYDEIEEGCSVPFLHMGECVAKQLKEEKLRPLEAGSPLRIGVLSTNQTSFYQEKIEEEGFEVILPDKATIEHTVIPALEALNRKDFEGAQNLFRIALQVLLVKAVNKVVLASDELQYLLPRDDPLWKRCIDPMDSLARSSIKIVRSTETGM